MARSMLYRLHVTIKGVNQAVDGARAPAALMKIASTDPEYPHLTGYNFPSSYCHTPLDPEKAEGVIIGEH